MGLIIEPLARSGREYSGSDPADQGPHIHDTGDVVNIRRINSGQ